MNGETNVSKRSALNAAERRAGVLAIAAAMALAWMAFSLLVWGYGESPLAIARLVFEGTWGTGYGIGQVVFKATPLIFTGLAVEIALRAGLFNIGVEGQLTMGALAAGAFGTTALAANAPSFVAMPLALACAAIASTLWGSVPAVLRAKWGAHEVISTIMMNRIADAVVGLALIYGLAIRGTARTADIAPGTKLSRLDAFGLLSMLRGSAANTSIVFALAAAIFFAFWFRRSRLGREIDLVGKNPVACRAEHMPVTRRLAQAMLISAAVAGLASSATVLGYKGYFETGLGAGAGFTGIAVALLGRGDPIGIVLAALLFGTIQQGGLAINAHVPMEVMDVIQGVIIVSVALADAQVRRALVRGSP